MKLPEIFIESLQNTQGFDVEAFEAVHQNGEQVTSIRTNPVKQTARYPFEEIIDAEIPWCKNGLYLQHRPSFTLDPIFHAGAYYVQEASSMFIEQAISQTVNLSLPIKVLDLCAAPGGKSTLIQSLLSDESVLVSNEVIKTRVNILAENITKWGAANVIVTNNDPKDFKRLENYFDVIVIDAPCSGSGLFRKDSAAIEEWSINNVELCSLRQQRIIADVFISLKENGILIYSTCSYSAQENEAIADWIIDTYKMDNIKLNIDDSWGIVETQSLVNKAFGYRFYPNKVKGEGFFLSVFSKKQFTGVDVQQPPTKKIFSKKKIEKIHLPQIAVVSPYLKHPENFFFFMQNEEVIAFPTTLENELAIIQSCLYIKKAGVKMGTIIRNELIPAHDLAISNIINPAMPNAAVDKETALQFLRRQDVKIATALKGWALVSYNNFTLGWIKILPNRINNYYPKDWRIFNK